MGRMSASIAPSVVTSCVGSDTSVAKDCGPFTPIHNVDPRVGVRIEIVRDPGVGNLLAAASSFSLVLHTSATAKPPCDRRLAAAAPTPGPYLFRTHSFMVGLASVVTVAKREREREREGDGASRR